MKHPLMLGLLLVLLFVVAFFWIGGRSVRPTEPEVVKNVLKEGPQSESGDSSGTVDRPLDDALPWVRLAASDYKIDYSVLSRELSDLPFEFRGQGTRGWVVDRQGNVLVRSSEEFGIFGVSVSPDRRKVLVKGGDGKNLILEPHTGRRITPPFRPPGPHMFPLSWYWIGPDLLFGVSGVERVFHEASHEDCENENNITQTRFYAFNLLTERLSGVVMPGAVTQPVVSVVEVMSDGHIHLRQEDPQESGGRDLGWFRIEVPK